MGPNDSVKERATQDFAGDGQALEQFLARTDGIIFIDETDSRVSSMRLGRNFHNLLIASGWRGEAHRQVDIHLVQMNASGTAVIEWEDAQGRIRQAEVPQIAFLRHARKRWARKQ